MSPKDNLDNLKTGGEILVDCLKINGVEKVFCVPGESYLAALDAFHDVPEIQLVICRQESGAAMMADAHARLTGKPGVCFVTRGPGATNASAGLHIAFQDSTALILLIGQIARDHTEREAFQEIDYRRMFGEMAKWVGQIDDEARVAEYLSHAFYRAQAGRPGPVVLALPEDMLTARAAPATITAAVEIQAHPGADDMQALSELQKVFLYDKLIFEPYAIGCYETADAGFFKAHRDNFNENLQHRRYAFTINLNSEEYEGGDLRFPEYGTDYYRPPTGGAIVFSCSLLHEVLPMTKGRRFILQGFIGEKPTQQA